MRNWKLETNYSQLLKMEAYKNWETDVKGYLFRLKEELDANEQAKQLYNGFYSWDSKLIFQPRVMFIGINPGDGNPNNGRSISTEPCGQVSYLEYLDGENNTYALARQTFKAFNKAGYSEEAFRSLLDNHAVKTNFYYIITKAQTDIKKCLDALGSGRFKEYWQRSYGWTGKLIGIIKPKVIICEGKSVFEDVKDLYEPEGESRWENGCGYFEVGYEDVVVIGYARRMSNIVNLDGLSELIGRFLPC